MILYMCVIALLATLMLYLHQTYTRFSRNDVKCMDSFASFLRVMFHKEHANIEVTNAYNYFAKERFFGRYEFLRPLIILRDVELIKRITIKDFECFVNRRHIPSNNCDPVIVKILPFMRGQEWKDMRSTLVPTFSSSKIHLMIPLIEEHGDQMAQSLKECFKETDGKYLDIDCKDLSTRYANDVIASCAFGLTMDSHQERNNQFYEMGISVTKASLRRMFMTLFSTMCPVVFKVFKYYSLTKEQQRFYTELVLYTMKYREEKKITRPDMIHLLMQVKNSWSDLHLVAQAVVFFIAGFETISTVLSFSLYELAIHSELQKRLVQEIEEYDATHSSLKYESLQSMKFMNMVVSEVLRLYPPVSLIERTCNTDYNLGAAHSGTTKEYTIRRGEEVLIPVWSIHRDPQYFPNPERFNPERFSEENRHLINPMTYMPFGSGPRSCIASRLALLETKIFIYKILKEFEVSPCPKTNVPARLTKTTFNVRMEGGHWLRFKRRNKT